MALLIPAVQDRDTDRALGILATEISKVLQVPLLKTNRVRVSIVSGTPLLVDHGLGRTPLGRLVVYQSANAVIWDGAKNDKTWTVNASANVTCDLEFF